MISRDDVVFVTLRMALAAHRRGLDDGGGTPGVLRPHYLKSAIGGVRAGYYASIASFAAAYAYAMVQNHPFVDGNKRAALLSAWLFLELNGVPVGRWDRPRWRRTMRSLAAGKIGRESLVRRFAREMRGDRRVSP